MKFDRGFIEPMSSGKTHQVGKDVQLKREIPVGGYNVFIMPLLALGSGVVMFVAAALAALAFQWPWIVPVAVAGIITGLVWLYLFLFRLDDMLALLWAIETVTGRDFNQDGYAGRPGVHVLVEHSDAPYYQSREFDLPGSRDALFQLINGTLSGKTLAEAEWTGRGRPYSKNEFRDLRAALIDRGLVVWRNPKAPSQGVELTVYGRRVFREIISQARTHAQDQGARPALLDGGAGGRNE